MCSAVIGAPLMLCSCCVVPICESVYQRTRSLGPSLGLMLAAPALNPAALVLTFLLFPAHIAGARLVLSLAFLLVLSLALVLVGAAVLGRWLSVEGQAGECPVFEPGGSAASLARRLGASLWDVSRRSLPAIILGVVLSVLVVQGVPLDRLASGTGALPLTLLVAALATLIALPTFGEIPLALALEASGAPDSAVIALLIAGPAIKLPSILSLAKIASPRAAAATALSVFLLSTLGGAVAALARI